MSKPNDASVTIRMPTSMLAAVDELAGAERRDRSEWIRLRVEEAVNARLAGPPPKKK